MINTIDSKSTPDHENKGDILKKLQQQSALPEDKRDPVKKLGKDEFFKIMITQMKNQDPTNPYKNEELAAHLAQFTSLEQMLNMNQNLEKLMESQFPLQKLGAAGLIGKTISTDSSQFAHTEGKFSGLNFDLPTDAAKAKIAIMNGKGEVIRELDQTNLMKGGNKVEWDGKRSNNMMAPTGTYSIRVTAESAEGKSVPISTKKKHEVFGVSFDGKETVLLVGNSKTPEKVLLRAVTSVEDLHEKGPAKAAEANALLKMAQPLGAAEIPSPQAMQNMQDSLKNLEFEKVVPQDKVAQSGKFTPIAPNIVKQDRSQEMHREAVKAAQERQKDGDEINPAAQAQMKKAT